MGRRATVVTRAAWMGFLSVATMVGAGNVLAQDDAPKKLYLWDNRPEGHPPPPSSPEFGVRHPPRYPPSSIFKKHEGTVVLLIFVKADGTVRDVEIDSSSGFGELDHSALAAARDWTYTPEEMHHTFPGDPRESIFRLGITFALRQVSMTGM